MSMMHCPHCDEMIDTDYNAEHFDDGGKQCKEEQEL